MEHFNQALFLLLNAAPGSAGIIVGIANFMAEDLIWIVPVGLILGWLYGTTANRQILVAAMVSGLAGLLINQIIGWVWYHPRPFEVGIGQTLIPHVQDSSFPSDHLTFVWAIAFSLLRHEQSRLAGWALAVLGVPVAWARVYLGVHFPLDILGAVLVALSGVWLISWQEHHFIELLMRPLLRIYQTLFAGLIRRGWVRQ
ncbi:phosphoesterase [Rugosibacter aromaticivorans]|uniref:Phosphoesterase n=1 Tax=Rugosibacter aromaticivorans TaxID=1565605 RepID=A0A0C5J7E4_9PROT|nr:phosphatase PAP2 family protein [Rugosibacter aromaticivorans]AJP47564.1 phosphoesterase [Rugosibacter aromaticivorans]TBR16440.1 MAG: phosphatase PAP2 family protein [Rugosibacter sp.]